MPQTRILAIVPAFNEEHNIRSVVTSIRNTALPDMYPIDVAVVNDGSKDGTKYEAEQSGGKVLDLPFNLGIGGAVQTGFRYACKHSYDIAIQIDGDGQHDPAYIFDIIQPIVSGEADVVIGSRFLQSKKNGFRSTLIRRVGIKIFYIVNSLAIRQKITDNTSGFRAYNRKALEYLKDRYPVDYPEPEAVVLLGKKKFRIKEIPVIMKERAGGTSSITAVKSVYYMMKVLLAIFIDLVKK